jgi:hypothetical protein
MDAGVAHGLHDGHGAPNIDCVIVVGIVDRLGDTDSGSQVIDTVYSLEQGPELGYVPDIPPGQQYIGRQPPGISGCEIIDHEHSMAVCQQATGQSSSQKSCTSRDKRAQLTLP